VPGNSICIDYASEGEQIELRGDFCIKIDRISRNLDQKSLESGQKLDSDPE